MPGPGQGAEQVPVRVLEPGQDGEPVRVRGQDAEPVPVQASIPDGTG